MQHQILKVTFLIFFYLMSAIYKYQLGLGTDTIAYILRKPIMYSSFVDFDIIKRFNIKSFFIFKNFILKKK